MVERVADIAIVFAWRGLTGDPPEMAARATAYLEVATELLLTDLVVAETVYMVESFTIERLAASQV